MIQTQEPVDRGNSGHADLQATIALMKDGTIAIEVSTALTLIQWPFLTDISLAWAAASIFDPSLVENEADPSLSRTEIDAVLAIAAPPASGSEAIAPSTVRRVFFDFVMMLPLRYA